MKLKINDVFRWRYIDVQKDIAPYHCRSCVAIWDGKRFIDTFWHGSDNFCFYETDLDRIGIEYVANLDDLTPTHEDANKYYDNNDIVDIRHNNRSDIPVYLKKGVQKSKRKMAEVAKAMIADRRNTIDRAQRGIDELEKDLEQIESASVADLDSIFLWR